MSKDRINIYVSGPVKSWYETLEPSSRSVRLNDLLLAASNGDLEEIAGVLNLLKKSDGSKMYAQKLGVPVTSLPKPDEPKRSPGRPKKDSAEKPLLDFMYDDDGHIFADTPEAHKRCSDQFYEKDRPVYRERSGLEIGSRLTADAIADFVKYAPRNHFESFGVVAEQSKFKTKEELEAAFWKYFDIRGEIKARHPMNVTIESRAHVESLIGRTL